MSNQRIFLIILLSFSSYFYSFAQKQRASFPKGYFQFPIYAGQKHTLAGVLGDLRTNHFHAGIDIRTDQREGLPVQAAADGYVSKIKVQTTGYGNVIYVKHPNGMTTVYGHLQSFAEPMRSFLKQRQYSQKVFEIEINPNPNEFLVKKGELIGLSGNTGGSAGPHLHFEIRDAKDNYLNPLLFDFAEIKDNIPPYFNSLAIRPMTPKSRLNGAYDRIIFKPTKQPNGHYSIGQTIKAHGDLGVEMIAFDAMNDVNFRNGVNCVEIKLDGEEIFAYNMTEFPSWTTRDYNNLIDYATEQRTGSRFLKCYDPDGNLMAVHKTNAYKGKIHIADTLEHKVEITLFDSFENSAILDFTIKGEMPQTIENKPDSPLTDPTAIKAENVENVLKMSAWGLGRPINALAYTKNRIEQILPAYTLANETVYLIDLRKTLPDSVQIGNKTHRTYLKSRIAPNQINSYTNARYDIRFTNQSLFDTLYLAVQPQTDGLIINDIDIPLKDAIAVNFKPDSMPDNAPNTHIYRWDDGRWRFVGGKWGYNQISFNTRELGRFKLLTDTIPPRITLVQANKKQISARISDATSGIEGFKAMVNGQWVLMNYDYKKALIWSDKLVDSLDFEGEILIEVTDRAGNVANVLSEVKEVVAVQPKKAVKQKAKSKPAPRRRVKKKK